MSLLLKQWATGVAGGQSWSSYWETHDIPFTITSTGNGTGVAAIELTSNKSITITLDGVAKFYTDAAGTIGETNTWTFNGHSVRYIRCTSGSSTFLIKTDATIPLITKWELWTSGTNAPNLSGDITRLVQGNLS